MKSNLKKRILAAVLCMVMVFSGSSFAMAGDADTTAENGTEVSQDTGTTTTSSGEESQEQTTSGETGEMTEGTQETGEQTETTTPETTTPDTTAPETTTGNQETETAPATEEPVQSPAYDGKYEDDTVTISVSAEAGIVPEGAELSVTPIEKTEITDDMSEEDKAKAEEINAQYDLTEKKLNEDSEENEETMEGFLAYDISFLVNGEEVEPSGDVKVVMDFKEAAIPEGVSEDAAVAVKHLKEDETAEDGVVVEDMAEKADVQTTDKAEVERVEFTANSFSIYTIKYSYRNSLEIHVVDSSGKPLGEENQYTAEKDYSWTGEEQNRVDVNTIAQDIKGEINGLPDFNKAVYVEAGEEFSYSAPRIYALMDKENDIWKCTNESFNDNNGWRAVGGGTVYFIFGEKPEEPELSFSQVGTVSTIDTIDINLFDYQVGIDGDESATWDSNVGINKGHVLKFVDDKGEDQNTVNIYQDSDNKGRINDDMVQNQLNAEGYPVLSDVHSNRKESLVYLFDENSIDGAKEVYEDLDKLFIEDENGYLTFDSTNHYAYLKNEGSGFASEFTVGNISGQSSPGFYPFSQPTSSTISDIKNSSDDAVLGSTEVNHYYGMTIETSFIQPKGGMVNNQDMIFEFSGDDDVWVFIDDVLVLDLGGIHGAVSGKINFATGQVTRTDINGGQASGITLGNAFREAGVNDVEWEANTGRFADYTTHTIKFFYLERGNRDSNCKIKFNFPTIPKNSVSVAKEVTNPNGAGLDYADDIDFQFNIKVNGNNCANQKYALWENGEEVIDDSGKQVIDYTDSEGNFTLKHDQMAVFSGIQEDFKYQVTELGAYLNGYEVTVDGTRIGINETEEDGKTIYSATTGELTVGDDSSVVFKNAIDDTATLSIHKELAAGEELTDKYFQIHVKIQGDAYNGRYSVDGTPAGNASNGIIQLQAGHTATITGLPYGASFEVEEMPDGVYQPVYEVNGNVTNIVVPDYGDENNTVTTASAQIIGQNANVTVTNSKLEKGAGTTDVTVDKEWLTGSGTYDLPEYVTVTLYKDVNHNGDWDEADEPVTGVSPIQLNAANGWHGLWEELPGDTDFVVREKYPEGYRLKTTESANDITNVTYIDRVETCRNLIWDLQKNNMLVTKKGNDWVIWTLYDLGLSENERKQVVDWVDDDVNGNMGYNNTEFAFGAGGFGPNSDIVLVDRGNGNWQLQFGKSSTWSMFWYLKYDRTQAITLKNEIIPEHETSLDVTKVWSDDNPSDLTVEVQLLQNGVPYIKDGSEVKVILSQENGWKHTFTGLPYFTKDGNHYTVNQYTVKETQIGEEEVVGNFANGYRSSISGSMEDGYVITNTKTTPWQIIKVSSNDSNIKLEGAEFTLTTDISNGVDPEKTVTYWGKSDNNGIVKWFSDSQFTEGKEVDVIPDGDYILTETKAPGNYIINNANWSISIHSGTIVIANETGTDIGGVLTFYYKNTPLYTLPSAGGPGIYWYTIGGILLMIAGTLVLYKNKRREVLKR